MTYNKPEIKELGNAVDVIAGGKSLPVSNDASSLTTIPAYDLDE